MENGGDLGEHTCPSPGRAHTQHPLVSQSGQGVQQEVGAAVGEQVLGVALLVVQRTEHCAGPPQLSCGDSRGSVRGVSLALRRKEQNLTILTELLLIQREGGELSEPEGQMTDLSESVTLTSQNSENRSAAVFLTSYSTPAV